MNLKEYLKHEKISPYAFAKIIDASPQHVYRLMQDGVNCSKLLAAKIRSETGFVVEMPVQQQKKRPSHYCDECKRKIDGKESPRVHLTDEVFNLLLSLSKELAQLRDKRHNKKNKTVENDSDKYCKVLC